MTTPLKTETFEITVAQFIQRINPNDDPEGFVCGSNASYTEAELVELLQTYEDTVLSLMPEPYRRMSRSTQYHGEVLTRRAKAGQTTLTPSLLPLAEGTVKIYVNYPKDQPWVSDERDYYALDDDKFSANYTTGVITIPSLVKDDWVYASYDHKAGSKLRLFKRLALDLAIVQVSRDAHLDMENYQMYQDMESNVFSIFKKMKEKGDARLGIDLFDRVPTVVPLRSPAMTISW